MIGVDDYGDDDGVMLRARFSSDMVNKKKNVNIRLEYDIVHFSDTMKNW